MIYHNSTQPQARQQWEDQSVLAGQTWRNNNRNPSDRKPVASRKLPHGGDLFPANSCCLRLEITGAGGYALSEWLVGTSQWEAADGFTDAAFVRVDTILHVEGTPSLRLHTHATMPEAILVVSMEDRMMGLPALPPLLVPPASHSGDKSLFRDL